jgi:hypothetical protein
MLGQASSKLCRLAIGQVRSRSTCTSRASSATPLYLSIMQIALEQASADGHNTVDNDICRPGYETHKYHFEGLAGD